VDVHPDRPISRGIAPGPSFDKVLCAIPPDPTLTQIEEAGGILDKHAEGHAVAGGTVWVSGEIPRLTAFETGMLSAVRWVQGGPSGDAKGKWVPEHVSGCFTSEIVRWVIY
jgi:7,8-dihydropterin-6-yl-methyl-4-(beta-D-ribofuranosyl)aminobenzene 5'-phosphate synthase